MNESTKPLSISTDSIEADDDYEEERTEETTTNEEVSVQAATGTQTQPVVETVPCRTETISAKSIKKARPPITDSQREALTKGRLKRHAENREKRAAALRLSASDHKTIIQTMEPSAQGSSASSEGGAAKTPAAQTVAANGVDSKTSAEHDAGERQVSTAADASSTVVKTKKERKKKAVAAPSAPVPAPVPVPEPMDVSSSEEEEEEKQKKKKKSKSKKSTSSSKKRSPPTPSSSEAESDASTASLTESSEEEDEEEKAPSRHRQSVKGERKRGKYEVPRVAPPAPPRRFINWC